MNTLVSYDGYLQKVSSVQDKPPAHSTFVSFGRLVRPSGHYDGCPVVSLYQTQQGFIAVR